MRPWRAWRANTYSTVLIEAYWDTQRSSAGFQHTSLLKYKLWTALMWCWVGPSSKSDPDSCSSYSDWLINVIATWEKKINKTWWPGCHAGLMFTSSRAREKEMNTEATHSSEYALTILLSSVDHFLVGLPCLPSLPRLVCPPRLIFTHTTVGYS